MTETITIITPETKRHYIRFYIDQSFLSNTSHIDSIVLGWNEPSWQNFDTNILISELQSKNRLLRDMKWPQSTFAFQIYKQTSFSCKIRVYTGNPVKVGPLYYHPDSRIETLEEFKKNPKADSFLISRMEENKCKMVVWTRFNKAFNYESYKDRVLSD